MKDLIRALQILAEYGNPDNPTHCEHDKLTICGIDPADVSEADVQELDDLGFFISDDYGEDAFHSFRYGSA